jgi:hypothetical protein
MRELASIHPMARSQMLTVDSSMLRLLPVRMTTMGVTFVFVPLFPPAIVLVAISAWLWSQSRTHPGQCCRCGYDLTGNTTGVCPECGVRRQDRQSVMDERA